MLLYIMPVHLLIVYAVAFAIRDGTWTVCGAQMVSAGVDPALCSSFGAIEATSWSLGRALYRGELWRGESSFVCLHARRTIAANFPGAEMYEDLP